MAVELSDFISVYRLTSGRAAYALRQSLAAAQELNLVALAGPIERALATALRCRALELSYKRPESAPLHGQGANVADAELDRAWSRLASTLANTAELFGAATPEGIAGARLLERIFPEGVAAITSLPYVEEQESSRLMVGRLRAAPLASDVATLHLEPAVARLSALTDQLGEALQAKQRVDIPKWEEVRAARLELHQSVLRMVARICGSLPEADATSTSHRTALLAPLLEQQERMVQRYRARLGATDIDPSTGEEEKELPPGLDGA